MTKPPEGLRAANVYSLILLGIGCLLFLSTAILQGEILASWDPASPMPQECAVISDVHMVFDPTGGLILKRYLIGGVYLICGLATHAWIRGSRKDDGPEGAGLI